MGGGMLIYCFVTSYFCQQMKMASVEAVHVSTSFFFVVLFCFCSSRCFLLTLCLAFTRLPLLPVHTVEHSASHVRDSARDREFDSLRQKFWMADRCFKEFNLWMFQNKFLKHWALIHVFEWLSALFLWLYIRLTFCMNNFNQQHSWVQPEAILKSRMLDNK